MEARFEQKPNLNGTTHVVTQNFGLIKKGKSKRLLKNIMSCN